MASNVTEQKRRRGVISDQSRVYESAQLEQKKDEQAYLLNKSYQRRSTFTAYNSFFLS